MYACEQSALVFVVEHEEIVPFTKKRDNKTRDSAIIIILLIVSKLFVRVLNLKIVKRLTKYSEWSLLNI